MKPIRIRHMNPSHNVTTVTDSSPETGESVEYVTNPSQGCCDGFGSGKPKENKEKTLSLPLYMNPSHTPPRDPHTRSRVYARGL
jgi:hypothetical protein